MRRFAIPALLWAIPALAQTSPEPTPLTLPDLVVTATRIPTPAADVPAGVTVITRAQIEAHGWTTLTEALNSVPGTHIVQSGGPGQQASLFIRGAASNGVLVLRDGIPINDPSDPGGAYNFGEDTTGDIERIEIVRGPLSGLYGSGATGGVVNIITKRGTGGLHGTAELAAGLPRALLGRLDASGSTGKWDYSLAAQGLSDRSFDVTPRRQTGVYTGERDGFRSQLGTVNLGYTPLPGTRIGLILRGRRSISGFDQQGYDDPYAAAHDTTLYGRVGVTSLLAGGAWETSLQLGALRHDRRYTDLLSNESFSSGVSRYGGRRESLDWQNTIHLGDYGAVRQLDVTLGYQHLADQAHIGVDTAFAGFPFQQSLAAHADSDAGYFGVQAVLFRRLTLSAQGREEATSLAGDAFTWRAGGVFALTELGARLKASYGTAFRAPSLYDRYGVDSTGYVGNPQLRPERSTGFEGGAEVDVPLAGRADFATLGATYFENHFRDLIQFQFAPVETEVNVARASSSGVELTATIRATPWATVLAQYTYTDTRDDATGARLLRRPLNAASVSATLRPWPKLEIAPEIVYSGAFTDYLVDDTGVGIGPGRARGYVFANLSATYQLAPKLAVFVWGRNIGGSRYEPANGFAAPGASFLAGVRAGF